MKKFLCFALCIIFCLGAFASCGLKEDEKGASVNVFISGFPNTLDPAVVQINSDAEQIISMIFEPLTSLDEDGKVKPALAEEWYYKYDEIYQKHQMHFELKTTSWSDNRQVTADDVIYAWRRILDPAMDSPYASLLYIIKGARSVKSGVGTIDDLGLEAWDDTHLVVTFENDYFNTDPEIACELFAQQVSNVHLSPCREDIVTRCEKAGDDWAASATDIVCNGEFRVQSMDMPRARKESDGEDYDNKFACKLVLERNAYYMRDVEDDDIDEYVRPYRINCYYYEGLTEYYPNETGLTQQLFQSNRFNSGEIYYLSSFTKDSFASYKEDLETSQTLNGFAFYFNTENEILKDAKVRQALSVALDRNAIVTETTGTGEIAATGYVPNGVFNTDRKTDFRTEGGNLYNTASDINKAKELAKGKKGTLTVTYLVPTNDYTIKNYGKKIDYTGIYENIAKKAGEYWKSLGFTIKYKGLNPDDYTAALKNRDYDIIGVNVISGSADALNYLAPFAKEFSGTSVVVDNSVANADEVFNTHYTNFDNKDYSALIETAYKAGSLADRAKALHDAEAKLVELCPATMVFWYTYSYVASDEISGYENDSWFGYVNMIDLKLSDWRDVNSKEAEILEARDNKKK